MTAMTDTHAWLYHPPTEGYWQCPVDAVDIWKARGWEPCDAPPEVDTTTAHRPASAAPVPAAPAAKKDKPVTPAKAENEEKIDG